MQHDIKPQLDQDSKIYQKDGGMTTIIERLDPSPSLAERRSEKRLGLISVTATTTSTATDKPGAILRRSSSIRELRHLLLHKLPDKLFKKSYPSYTSTPTATFPPLSPHNNNYPEVLHENGLEPEITPDASMKRINHPPTVPSKDEDGNAVDGPPPVPPKDTTSTTMARLAW